MTEKNFSKPKIPLPAPQMMSEANPFAYFTLTKRMPAIVQRVISENDFCTEIVYKLETLSHELPEKTISYLTDQGQDVADWNRYLQPMIGKHWIDIPWFFAEAYFYRRILQATHYFLPGSFGVDPYALQKRRGLETAISSIREISTQNNNSLIALLYFCLWVNRADMSLFPINTEDNNQQAISLEQSQVLIDDTAQIVEKISNFNKVRIDFIIDNAGLELFGDLCLVDFLLTSQAAEIIYLHLKPYPTFVSDATIQDVHDTLAILAADDNKQVQLLAQRLQNYIIQGRLICHDDYFWTSPLMFWEMPEALKKQLAQSSLIIIKGDANYRRCLGDLHWSFTTNFADVVCYFPAPIVVLRTLKSEIAVGLQIEQVEKLNKEDPNWLTNGQWGIIQLVE
ncbi:MAG: damage-control phosphatase ARMT1 family protein [Coleofasciculaceae cyanobacterium]